MSAVSDAAAIRRRRWAGWIVTAIPSMFLLMDAGLKLLKAQPAIETTVQLGYTGDVVPRLGVLLAICTLLYLIPRTAVLGCILLTGYLGGAVATHVRAGNPLFPMIFPVILGTLLWGGLWLREHRLRSLLPLTRPT